MANLIRKLQKVFAGNAINNGQFGSLQAGTKVLSSDVDTLQALTAYQNGWNDAVISGEQLPSLEEMQALNYINTYQIAYLQQKGIPEYLATQDYYIGDITREVGGTKIYRSITNNNVGNALTDIANWQLLIDFSGATTTTKGTSLLPNQITIANGTDTEHDIDFSAGNFQFDDGTGQDTLSAITKQIDATWVAGTGGGLFSGTVAIDTWYHAFAIYNPATKVSDAGFDTSITAANAPSGFTKKKRVGSILTNGSGNIIQFKQRDKYFEWKNIIIDQSIATIISGRNNISISTPLGIEVIAYIRAGLKTDSISDITVNLISPYNDTITPLSGNGEGYDSDASSELSYVSPSNLMIATDTNSSIDYVASRTLLLIKNFTIRTKGYLDYTL